MNRRAFIKSTAATSLAASLVSSASSAEEQSIMEAKTRPRRLLNAYYLRGHMYTMVPRHVREDLQWMQDLGTDAVSVAVIEQDLFAAVENIEIICSEASKLGMKVFAVPSRWGGLFAGAPKVPSLFSVLNPQTWVLNEDGTPLKSSVSGVISSIHYEETYDFICEKIDQMYELWDLAGVIWDEPKLVRGRDFSPKAIERLGRNATELEHVESFADFMSRVCVHAKNAHPDKRAGLFCYANIDDPTVDLMSRIEGIDDYGCDGRPWSSEDGGKQESHGKALLGKDAGERFIDAARNNGKNSLWLIENHNMATADLPKMERRMPEILSKGVDHLIYYYYPRNLEDPDAIMGAIAKLLR